MPADKLDAPIAPVAATARPRARSMTRLLLIAVLVACVLGVGGWAVLGGSGTSEGAQDLGPTAVVTRGTLVCSVTETGEVEAEKRKVISNELRYAAVIKSVVSEGSQVKAGDTIIEFECKELVDDIEGKKIAVTAAQNAFTQARENLVLKQKEVDNTIRKAKQDVVDANSDLKRYIEGEGPTKLGDADSAISTAKRDLALAEDKLNFKLKVNADEELKSPFSKNDIEAERLSVDRLRLALEKADSNRKMLLKYDHPREIRRLNMAVEDAELALARAELEARSELLKAQADLDAAKTTFDMQDRKLKELLEDSEKMLIKADKEGLVVYDTAGNRWSGNDIVVEVGAKINPRQQLMIIPDMTTLQIRTKVYESIIDEVKAGLRAHVRLENKPDQTYTGRIFRVGVLPDSQNRWLNPGVKIFAVIVKLDKDIEGLRPGMTSEVEIELARLNDTLSVPVASVFTAQDQTFCYRVKDDGNYERVPIKVGRMNDTRVQVLSGLSEGDRLLLSPPRGEHPQPVQSDDKTKKPENDPKGPPPIDPAARPEKDAGSRGKDGERPARGEKASASDRPDRPARQAGQGGRDGAARGTKS